METTTRDITEKLIEGLRKAATELEEFQLQFALGKADAEDKYEEIKNEFDNYIHKAETKMYEGIDKASELKAILEDLQVQLKLGKADTLDAFKEQKAKIDKKIIEIEQLIKNNKVSNDYIPALKIELEKFKAKLDVLYVRYNIEDKKNAFNKEVENLKSKFVDVEKTDKWKHFTDEIEESFKHFKNAFKH